MNAAHDDGPRCSRCRAPVSLSGGRCTLCGAPVEGTDGARVFEPAPVGIPDGRLMHDTTRNGSPTPPHGTSKAGMVVGALALMGALAIVVFLLARKSTRGHDEAAGAPLAQPAAAASTAAPLNMNGIAIASAASVDPTDLMPAVKRRLAESGRTLSLLGVEVIGAKQGVVNLDDAGTSIVYRFLLSPENPRLQRDTPPPPEVVELSLTRDPPEPTRTSATPQDKSVVEPTCVWSAAWRAAVASGLSEQEPVDATYGTNARSGASSWVFTPKNRPESSREIDGQSCAIKAR